MWQAQGWRVSICPTRAAGHAVTLARQAANAGHRLVLAAGGDGTLGQVANGLAGTETVMAPLPVGTGNSFAKELQMPRPNFFNQHKLLQAVKTLTAGRVQRVDLGYVYREEAPADGRYWLLWAGTGADGFLVNRMEPRPPWSKRFGVASYLLKTMAILPHFPPMRATVTVDGRLFRDVYILVLLSNCRRYGGGELLLTPQAYLDDGLFEVWLFPGQGMAQIFRYVWQVRFGRHHQNPGVHMASGCRVTVRTDSPVPFQTDGEKAGHTPFICEIKPGALRLLVPATAPADLFSQPGEHLER